MNRARGAMRFLSVYSSLTLLFTACLPEGSPSVKSSKEFTGCIKTEEFKPGHIKGTGGRAGVTATPDRLSLTVEIDDLGTKTADSTGKEAKKDRDAFDPGDSIKIQVETSPDQMARLLEKNTWVLGSNREGSITFSKNKESCH